MVWNSILCPYFFSMILPLTLLFFSCFFGHSYSNIILSSFSYPQTRLHPFQLRYIRVELPPSFSSMSITLDSDVDLDITRIGKIPKTALPIICFRDGSPPLPEISNTSTKDSALFPISNTSLERLQGLQNFEQCYPMQKTISLKLTNEEITPGIWYFGLFNGIGDTRTQSKMIIRGSAYYFSANITVEGCETSTMWGPNCNRTVDPLFCIPSNKFFSETPVKVVSCKSILETSCYRDGESKVYSLEIVGIVDKLTVITTNVSFNSTSNPKDVSEIDLMYYARYGSIPSANLHDYSGNLDKGPLVVNLPKLGWLYISVFPVNLSKVLGGVQVCYSVQAQLLECPLGKAGSDCSSEKFILQTVLRKNPAPFEAYFLPINSGQVSSNSANFPLDPFLSNSSSYSGDKKPENSSWSYFLFDIPHGAAGGNIHVHLSAARKLNYEAYARFGGLPSLESFDYYYANKTQSSDGFMFFKSYNSSEEAIDFYILYVQEGTWGIGLRHTNNEKINNDNSTSLVSKDQTTMSISLERCPKDCSHHGRCEFGFDASGITAYSFCSCDRNHGGFDCSIEIVSHQGHIWQSISLVASNGAAILPAFWALQQKAFAEWVIFTTSGISSGLYHACDVGTWCALSFNVLQFLDFWLSFMAVVSTFLYLASINEVHKRAIHTVIAILTALMALTKATRSSNIIIVIAIGGLALLVGWLIELSTKYRSFSFSIGICLNMLDRWEAVKGWMHNLMKTLFRKFRWGFVLAGFTALAMAAISWELETSQSYWIWHSVWHVTIYTSSFFFLCSKAKPRNSEDEMRPDGNYELTRQDSLPRGE